VWLDGCRRARAAVGYTGAEDRGQSHRPGISISSRRLSVSEAAVSELLARTLRDSAFAARLKAEPEQVLAELDLTDEERATILAGLRGTGGGARLDQRPRIAGRIV
jgi:hypothetical protein